MIIEPNIFACRWGVVKNEEFLLTSVQMGGEPGDFFDVTVRKAMIKAMKLADEWQRCDWNCQIEVKLIKLLENGWEIARIH